MAVTACSLSGTAAPAAPTPATDAPAGVDDAAATCVAEAPGTARWKSSRVWTVPFSRTSKSSFVRSTTGWPFLSRTMTSTTTAAVEVPNFGRSELGGDCWARGDAVASANTLAASISRHVASSFHQRDRRGSHGRRRPIVVTVTRSSYSPADTSSIGTRPTSISRPSGNAVPGGKGTVLSVSAPRRNSSVACGTSPATTIGSATVRENSVAALTGSPNDGV